MDEEKIIHPIIPITIAIGLVIILLTVGVFVSKNISDELEKEELDEQTRETIEELSGNYVFIIIVMIPLFFICFSIVILGRKQDEMELDSNIDTEKISIQPGKRIKEDPIDILKRRYVKGEIGSEEYTEKMSRL